MCGIAGWIGGQQPSERLRRLVAEMLEHRGPDDFGWLVAGPGAVRAEREIRAADGDLLLLHRRLSIIDLSTAGWQPMGTADRRFWIVFNGEIYNYLELRKLLEQEGESFASDSDTEVLLVGWARWGRAVLSRLVGMFALAVYDSVERTVTLARDPFGIKPLYFARSVHQLVFASEIPALLEMGQLPRRAAAEATFHYLRFGVTDQGASTLFEGVEQLSAGHYVVVDAKVGTAGPPTAYWEPDEERRINVGFDEAVHEVRRLFLENIEYHMRSDVPVGAALSGGIDSSAIVMSMRQVGGPTADIRAYSYVGEGETSEERWIDIVGQAARARTWKVRASTDDLRDDLPRLIQTQGEPFGSTSIFAQAQVFRAAAQDGVKVMLDGQGADEMLAGYQLLSGARLGSQLIRGDLRGALRLLRSQPANAPAAYVVQSAASYLVPPSMQEPLRRLVARAASPKWLSSSWFRAQGVRMTAPSRPFRRDVLRGALWASTRSLSLPHLLRYEDRNSMAVSIESRVPFLTASLCEYLLSLPEEFLVSDDGVTKNVFRAAMRGLVPDVVLDRRDKIGFATPEQSWLLRMAPWIESVLASPQARACHALNLSEVHKDWEAIKARRARFDFRVWRWVNLIEWGKAFSVEF